MFGELIGPEWFLAMTTTREEGLFRHLQWTHKQRNAAALRR